MWAGQTEWEEVGQTGWVGGGLPFAAGAAWVADGFRQRYFFHRYAGFVLPVAPRRGWATDDAPPTHTVRSPPALARTPAAPAHAISRSSGIPTFCSSPRL